MPRALPYVPRPERAPTPEAPQAPPDVPGRLGGDSLPTGDLVILPLVLSGKAVVALERRAADRHMTLAAYVMACLDPESP